MIKMGDCSERLIKEFPYLYRKVICGVSCPEGWYELVRDLSSKLEPMMLEYNTSLIPEDAAFELFVNQVKSKFGGLRFYVSSGTDEMYELINEAEQASYSICEYCGKPGTQETANVWVTTCCPEHSRNPSGKHE